jgi:muramidase (phage lysozyme)
MFTNRQGTINNLQLMKKVYNRKNSNIPPNKVIELAKIIRKYPPEIQDDIITMYLKARGDVSNNDINRFAQAKLMMSNPIKNKMRKIGKNNIPGFIQIVKSEGERNKNSKKLTAGEWQAFSKLWFEVHPDSIITYNKVLTNQNKLYYNKNQSGSGSGLGIGLMAATTVAAIVGLFFSGKI